MTHLHGKYIIVSIHNIWDKCNCHIIVFQSSVIHSHILNKQSNHIHNRPSIRILTRVCVTVQFFAILVEGAELSCFCYGGTANSEGHP